MSMGHVYDLVPTLLQRCTMQQVFTLGYTALIQHTKLFLSQKQLRKNGHDEHGDIQILQLIWRKSFSLSQESQQEFRFF